MKHKVFFLFLAFSLFARAQSYLGDWTFIYYENAPTFDGNMPPPPLFNAISLKKDGQADIHIRIKGIQKSIPYTVNRNIISFDIPVEGNVKPIHFSSKFAVSKKQATMTLTGKNSSITFIKTNQLQPCSSLAGTWSGGTDSFKEYMILDSHGFFKLQNIKMVGFFVLWEDKDKFQNMTLIASLPNAPWRTFLWQVTKQNSILKMIPIGAEGLKPQHTSLWQLEN